MSKSFKENMQSQVGNLVEVQTRNGFQKIGLLLNAELPDPKMTWRDQIQGSSPFKWGWSAHESLWISSPSKRKKMLALSIFSDGFVEVFMVCRDDIKAVT